MRVVTFNIHHATVGSKGPVRPDRLGEVCAAFDADVLVLQEVDVATVRVRRVDLARTVADATGMAPTFGASRRFLGGWYGNALFVRGDLRRWEVSRLPRVPWWRFSQERRTYLSADVTVDGHDVHVVGTHLAVSKPISARQLQSVLRHATDREGPSLVLGDFNRGTSEVSPQAAAVGLATVAHGPTFPVSRPQHLIDHVLHSAHLRVRQVEVRATEMSDHCALLVDLDWIDDRPAVR